MSPIDWLQRFGATLLQTQARACGKAVPVQEAYAGVQKIFEELQASGGTLHWVGNGGSLALCSHLSQDVLNKLGVRSQVLNDPSLLTCMANDFGYEEVFRRPLSTLLRAGDVLIAISSSGKSRSILNAVSEAHSRGVKVIALSAFGASNPLWETPTEIGLYLPTELYGMAEVGHEALLHAVIESIWLRKTL